MVHVTESEDADQWVALKADYRMLQLPKSRLKRYALLALSVVFVLAGINHFVNPAFYARLIPPYLPEPWALVFWSGVFEVLGGLGVLVPQTRRWAGWGLVLMLACFLPTHVYMARHPDLFARVPAWALYARLPLQAVLMAWAYWATQPAPEADEAG